MKEYFYTNEQLINILEDETGSIDWVGNGFNIREVRQEQIQFIENEEMISVLPIFDKILFNKKLGDLIVLGNNGSLFYKVVNEEEYKKLAEHKKEIDEKHTMDRYNASKKTFEENIALKNEVEELDEMSSDLMLENLKLKGVLKND